MLLICACVYVLASGGCGFGEFKKNFKGWKSVHFKGFSGPTGFDAWSEKNYQQDPIDKPYVTPSF
jgi:hypothetical protein